MSGRLGLEETYRALFAGAVLRSVERAGVRVAGPGAEDYLQGQCTQDLKGLAVGESRFSLLLSVQGKVEALARVSRLEPDRFLLDTEAREGDALFERLRRFKVRVKADLDRLTLPAVELRGPEVGDPGSWQTDGVLVAPPFPRGPAGVDLIGVDLIGVDLIGVAAAPVPALHVPEGDPAAFEVARIEAGIPRAPEELDGSVIPFETGIVEETTSFTKGCYTGQELVARLEARGANVPRHLRAVILPPGPRPQAGEAVPEVLGASLRVGEKVVGKITSAAWSPRTGSLVALAYVGRAVEPPAEADLVPAGEGSADDGCVRVRVERLPLS